MYPQFLAKIRFFYRNLSSVIFLEGIVEFLGSSSLLARYYMKKLKSFLSKNNNILSFAILVATACTPLFATADELETSLNKVKDLVAQKNYSGALDELGWARKEVEKMNSGQLATFLPNDLNGFEGKKLSVNSAMGFTNIEREYNKGDATVRVSLTGGSTGGAGAGLGGLAAIGKMAAMFGGNTPGQETIRVQGRTAMLESDNSVPNLTIFLDSGSILKLEMISGKEIGVLKDMATALKLDDLEKYIKGGK